jgi:hypothetical protein
MTMKLHSLLEVKEVNEYERVVTGVATSGTPDRVGDVVVPEGVVFRGPINLHLYHKHDMPVGNVEFGRPTKSGKMPFRAELPDVKEAGIVQDRVNEAIHSLKYKLLGATSIGFRALANGVELLKSGGLKFNKWEMLELSLVSVPANPDAIVESFKSMDSARIRAAMGVEKSGEADRQALISVLLKGGVPLIQPQKHVDQALAGGAVRLIQPK